MISKLYLYGYIPLTFCGTMQVTYTPKALLQIIIGTNGSGKSSLLRALSLAPLDKSDFMKGGVRELEATFHEKQYRLVSHYKGGAPHHEFWVDGENLNPGGTSAVQKQLTESHLGYTAFHHKLLTGKLAFTEMSPNARKDLLVMISGLELDYAIDCFDKIRVVHRDIVGALKHLASKYSDTAKQLAAMDSVDELEEKAKILHDELTSLIPKTNFSVDKAGTKSELLNLSKKIEGLYRQYNKLHKKLKELMPEYRLRNGVRVQDKNQLVDVASVAQARLADVETKIGEHLQEHSKLEEQAAKFANLPVQSSREQYEAELDLLRSQLNALPEVSLEIDNLQNYVDELLACHSALLHYMEVFPEVPKFFTQDEVKQTDELHQELNAKYQKAKSFSDAVGMKISHAEAAREGNIKCPKCDEEILASGALTEERIAVLKEMKAKADKAMAQAEDGIKAVKETLESQDYYRKSLNHVRELANRYPLARKVFASEGPKYVIEFTKEVIAKVHAEHCDAKTAIHRAELQKTIEDKEFVLSLMKTSGKEKVLDRFKQVETELDGFYKQKQMLEEEFKHYCQIRTIFTEMEQYMNLLNDKYVPQYESLITKLSDDIVDENVNSLVRHKQDRLAEMNKTINDYRLVTTKLEELQEEEKGLVSRKQTLEILLHCLSSKKGIVGQQLHAVITNVSLSINEIIDEVWEKELLLVPPEFGKTLDFKFMTQIEGREGPDIKDLSEGQKEIVNFAMTLVIMRQLELESFPLLLDETSANMDSLHRGNFMRYIRELVDTGEFKSIYLVSHYASEYGGFTNADLVVMNPDNIGIPQQAFNENIMLA
ncbi:SbcC-like subunit of palindrome specific endonuclease [Vibrio phage vB_VpaM_sm033]|nr:SbcC-like subunit of palindrome specific endonuclease [Vibrio phage vB_VpaM_sm033]